MRLRWKFWDREPSEREKHELEWAGYCSYCGTLCPCFADHPPGSDARYLPFRLRPQWNESRYQGYELREMYGEDFPLFRDELAPPGWQPKPKPVKLSERWIFSQQNRFRSELNEVYTGRDGQPNAYGTVLVEKFNPQYPTITLETLPVICMHGGSGWLCGSCAWEMQQKHGQVEAK